MHFDLVDTVLETTAGEAGGLAGSRIVTLKAVSNAEEYLQDHFAGFPVLPGVLMVESLVQAGRRLLEARGVQGRLVLGGVRAVKYGRFVRPGDAIRVEVTVGKELGEGAYELKGEATLVRPISGTSAGEDPSANATAVSGRFTLRPVRLGTQDNRG